VASRIRKGDLVYVASGDDKGVTGRVLTVLPREGKAIVEKVNMVTKHRRARGRGQVGGMVTQEAPIHLSKLALVDPKTSQPVRIRWEIRPDGTKARLSKKSGATI